MQDMSSNQPYLLRAFFDWIVDNDLTPYMVVDVSQPDVEVPMQFVNDGQIVLNVSPSACVNFSIDTQWVQFQARFSGQPMLVSFPCSAVGAIYAKENGAGTVFTVPEPQPPEPTKATPELSSVESSANKKPASSTSKPGLRIVK
ncbi:MAG: ClpXP protease specificity-enhancing factor [Glaciecola sp.]